eukprot:SAG31_NODE_3693_length_3983_cov_2.012358_7_plen_99_part_01
MPHISATELSELYCQLTMDSFIHRTVRLKIAALVLVLQKQGWADQLIMPQGSVDYYDEMVSTVGGGLPQVQNFARLFMAPGIAHCGMDTAPFFKAVVTW